MGDRANVYVHDGAKAGVYLYTYSTGSLLPEAVRGALKRQERWDDDQYLTRIIFCHMLLLDREPLGGTTGFGISAYCGDGGSNIIDVDTQTLTVTIVTSVSGYRYTMYEYIKEPRSW